MVPGQIQEGGSVQLQVDGSGSRFGSEHRVMLRLSQQVKRVVSGLAVRADGQLQFWLGQLGSNPVDSFKLSQPESTQLTRSTQSTHSAFRHEYSVKVLEQILSTRIIPYFIT
ncbi:hypothetical protein Hdeb2414_s0077g00776961 [Helianthus debilis subsp. tardiflorus]